MKGRTEFMRDGGSVRVAEGLKIVESGCEGVSEVADITNPQQHLNEPPPPSNREKCKSCTKKPYSRVIFFFML